MAYVMVVDDDQDFAETCGNNACEEPNTESWNHTETTAGLIGSPLLSQFSDRARRGALDIVAWSHVIPVVWSLAGL